MIHWETWLEYLLRFSHLVSGIAWIGSSFYFIWLDSAFKPPEAPKKNVEGELFMVHGGFYYQVEKRKIFPGELPKILHWFKWEATLTWITGFLLLIAVYYFKGANLLVDSNVMPLTQTEAVLYSLGLIIGSWIIYDLIWLPRFAKFKSVSTVLSFALLGLVIYGNTQIFSGRGAFIQTGAMLGTMMLLNVWVRILPGQRKMVADAQAGTIPDYSWSSKAKTRSVHNTYFIFPVLFIMLSNHYPGLYNHQLNWLLLLVLSISGAMVRHVMVTQKPSERWLLIPALIGCMWLVFFTANPVKKSGSNLVQPNDMKVSFTEVQSIFNQRCTSCHSETPTDDVFKVTPKGVVLTSEAEVRKHLPLIYQHVVVSKTMPLANKTNITDEERAKIEIWIRSEGFQ